MMDTFLLISVSVQGNNVAGIAIFYFSEWEIFPFLDSLGCFFKYFSLGYTFLNISSPSGIDYIVICLQRGLFFNFFHF